jgi:hypothetical protein
MGQSNESAKRSVCSRRYFSSFRIDSSPLGHSLAVHRPCITGITYDFPPLPQYAIFTRCKAYLTVLLLCSSTPGHRRVQIPNYPLSTITTNLIPIVHPIPTINCFPPNPTHKHTHSHPPSNLAISISGGHPLVFCLFFSGSDHSLLASCLLSLVSRLSSSWVCSTLCQIFFLVAL